MDTSSDLVARTSRLARLLAVAVGVAFAWFLLTFALGASTAHAADDDDSGVLGNALETLAGTVGSLTAPVLDPVADAAAPVTDALAPVTDAVAPVVEAVAPVVAPVLEPLVDPLTPVLQPVATIVSPLAPALAPVAAVVAPVLPIDTILPPPASSPREPGAANPAVSTGDAPTDAVARDVASSAPTVVRGMWAAAPVLTAASTVVSASMSTLAFAAPLVPPFGGPVDATSSVFSSSSISGFGAAAALAFGLFAMHRAWAWRRGPGDESVPSSPIFATDVSPD